MRKATVEQLEVWCDALCVARSYCRNPKPNLRSNCSRLHASVRGFCSVFSRLAFQKIPTRNLLFVSWKITNLFKHKRVSYIKKKKKAMRTVTIICYVSACIAALVAGAADEWETRASLTTARSRVAVTATSSGVAYAIGGIANVSVTGTLSHSHTLAHTHAPRTRHMFKSLLHLFLRQNTHHLGHQLPLRLRSVNNIPFSPCHWLSFLFPLFFSTFPFLLNVVTTVEVYNVTSNTWGNETKFPVPIHSASATTNGDYVYVVGGFTTGWETALMSHTPHTTQQ